MGALAFTQRPNERKQSRHRGATTTPARPLSANKRQPSPVHVLPDHPSHSAQHRSRHRPRPTSSSFRSFATPCLHLPTTLSPIMATCCRPSRSTERPRINDDNAWIRSEHARNMHRTTKAPRSALRAHCHHRREGKIEDGPTRRRPDVETGLRRFYPMPPSRFLPPPARQSQLCVAQSVFSIKSAQPQSCKTPRFYHFKHSHKEFASRHLTHTHTTPARLQPLPLAAQTRERAQNFDWHV